MMKDSVAPSQQLQRTEWGDGLRCCTDPVTWRSNHPSTHPPIHPSTHEIIWANWHLHLRWHVQSPSQESGGAVCLEGRLHNRACHKTWVMSGGKVGFSPMGNHNRGSMTDRQEQPVPEVLHKSVIK